MRQESGSERLHAHPVLCRVLGHRRAGALVFTQGDGIWRSRCKRCGRKMMRDGGRRWVMDID